MSKQKTNPVKTVGSMVETLETRRLLAVALSAPGQGHGLSNVAARMQDDQPSTPASDTADETGDIPTMSVDTGQPDIGADESDGPGVSEDPMSDTGSGQSTDVVDVTDTVNDVTSDVPTDNAMTDTLDLTSIVPIAFGNPPDEIAPVIPLDTPVDVVPFEDPAPPSDGTTVDATIPTDDSTTDVIDTTIDDSTDVAITVDDSTETDGFTGIDDSSLVVEVPNPTPTDIGDSGLFNHSTGGNLLGPPESTVRDNSDGGSSSSDSKTTTVSSDSKDSHQEHQTRDEHDGSESSDSSSDAVYAHLPLPPVLSGLRDIISVVHTATAPQVQAPAVAQNRVSPETSSDQTASAQSQSHASAHETAGTVNATVAASATFSSTPIQPLEPIAPAAQAPLAAEVEQVVAVTPTDASAQEKQAGTSPDEHLKLQKVVVTFEEQSPVHVATAEPAPEAQTASATVAPEVAVPLEQPAGTIQLVQEIDVAPADAAAQTAAQAAGQQQSPRVLRMRVAQASMAGGMNDSSARTRNIVLAFTAGIASLAVHSYRASRRKLAAAARAAHLDPLAAWLDDPTYHAE